MIHGIVAKIFKAFIADFYNLNHLHFLRNCYFNSSITIDIQLQVVQLKIKENYSNLSTAITKVVISKFIAIHS
jgi:hypothetical protein